MMQWDEDTQTEFNFRITDEYISEVNAVCEWCRHDRTEIRRRFTASGQERYYYQCLECGSAAGAVARSNVRDPAKVRDFDPHLHDAYRTARERQRSAIKQKHIRLQKAAKQEWWAWYDEYLMSAVWRRKRKLVLDRAGGACEGCRLRPAAHVHHLTYDNVGHEFLWELAAVCEQCHERVHGRKICNRQST